MAAGTFGRRRRRKHRRAGRFGHPDQRRDPGRDRITPVRSAPHGPDQPGTEDVFQPAPTGGAGAPTGGPGTTISGTPGWEGDIGWQETNSWAANQTNQAKAQYFNELANLRTSSGLYDAQGGLIDQSRVEQLNPFSQAGMLRRAWREAQTGTLNSYAAAGQLYSGALKNASGVTGADPRSQLYEDQRGGYNSFGYHQGLDSVKSQFNDRKSALDQWAIDRGNEISGRLMDSGQDARDRWVESRPPPPRAPSPAPTAAHGPNQPGTQNVAFSRPPKPNRPPRDGFRWRFVNGRWRQVRRSPSR